MMVTGVVKVVDTCMKIVMDMTARLHEAYPPSRNMYSSARSIDQSQHRGKGVPYLLPP